MPERHPPAARLALAAAAACAACTAPTHGPARPTGTRPAAPAATTAPAEAGRAVPLPDTPASISAAAGLARRFAVADSSWSPGQPPAAWLAVLRPMTAAPLYAVLAQSAWTPALLALRDRTRQAATATVTGEQVRDLDPGTVTLTVQVRQHITSTTGTTTGGLDLAITVTGAGARQLVWDAEPAADGNGGRGGTADGPAAP